MIERRKFKITGKVQGVGFRPAVHQAAVELNLTGNVRNDTQGVTIELQGEQDRLAKFKQQLLKQLENRPSALIRTWESEVIEPVEAEKTFTIDTSESKGVISSEVTADTAVCRDCRKEMNDKNDFRYRYPFINCTNCGPRYSIVKNIPYDRANTTMSEFAMCKRCRREYEDIGNRRFHAQPVACPECGPWIWLTDNKGRTIADSTDLTISKTAEFLHQGKIAAIKGIGGFHLAVNAYDRQAVERLRLRKQREGKPFAMMTNSLETIRENAFVSEAAAKVLMSPESPIVLLKKKGESGIAPPVTEGVDTFGFMLCYAPLHFLLFEQCPDILVMTSANISEQPLICDNSEALEKLKDTADFFLMHNRDIYRQVDDSIVQMIDNTPVLLRRARGYVPEPVTMNTESEKNILATGGDMKNTFCIAKGNKLISSEHIGDISDAENYRHYRRSVEHLSKLFDFEPEATACDLHPGYISRQFAEQFKDTQMIEIQHHWAHICSVLAEHNVEDEVIGLECDGTGYGTDGAIWGCECMRASLEGYKRMGHLEYFPLAGGDKSSRYAIRPIIGLLKSVYGEDFEVSDFRWLTDRVEDNFEKVQIIEKQIEKNLNCVQTSSLGRLFDAVAGMAGLGGVNSFDAQLPMHLQAEADETIDESYDFRITKKEGMFIFETETMLAQLIRDIKKGEDKSIISSRFHNWTAEGLAAMAAKVREETLLNIVALSGGVFCNNYLLSKLIKLLKNDGFSVLFNRRVPSNDGGIALGQAAAAAKLLSRNSF